MDVLTKKQRSYNMSMIKSKNTNPEFLVKQSIKRNRITGVSYHPPLPGKPDLAIKSKKVVVFIDGCFWHKCKKCFKEPATRRQFWIKKIESNVIRDKKVNSELGKKGWKIIRIWEHQIRKDKDCTFIIKRLKNLS